MVRIFLTGLVLSGLLFGTPAEANASPTNPDPREQQYANHLHAIGLTDSNGDADIIRTGWGLCNEMVNQGRTPAATINQIFSEHHMDYDHANQVVSYAIADLCPSVIK